MQRDHDTAGFALIEILVAFTIAAGMLAALFGLYSRNLHALARTEAYARAVQLAESRLESLGTAEPLAVGTEAGRFDGHFGWRLAVTAYPAPSDAGRRRKLALYQVHVTVSWREGRSDLSVSLDSLRIAVVKETKG